MSSNSNISAAAESRPGGFAKTPLPTSTPIPTYTFTPTPGPGTPTAVVRVDCPSAGCPYTVTPTSDWMHNEIWYGQTPPGGENKPVLVFLHGISGLAQDWWGETDYSGVNDMYVDAYNDGYRTAFVDLQYEPDDQTRGPYNNQWQDGSVVASQIDYITSYFNVPTVVLVGHSKGGVDAQAGIWLQKVSYANKVSALFLLSTPNLGSALANIYCTPVANGQQMSAMCGMEPTNMGVFRCDVDPLVRQFPIPIYVSGGTDHGPQGSLLYAGGQILEQYGSNDGFVNVSSALGMGNSHYMFVRSVNHDSIRVGHNSMPFIDSVLRSSTPVPMGGTPVPSFCFTPTATHN
jgi:pimeloyl-ACP methyl ester carboxylesterase